MKSASCGGWAGRQKRSPNSMRKLPLATLYDAGSNRSGYVSVMPGRRVITILLPTRPGWRGGWPAGGGPAGAVARDRVVGPVQTGGDTPFHFSIQFFL